MKRHYLFACASVLILGACGGEEPSSQAPEPPASDEAASAAPSGLPAAMAGHPAAGLLSTALEEVRAPYSDPAATAADLAPLAGALPDGFSLAWGAQQQDAATGATVWTDFELRIAVGEASFGVSADTVRAWDLDADFLGARLSGERLGEAGALATRIEADNLELTGMDLFMETLFAGFFDSMGEAETFEELDLDVETFEVTQTGLIIEDLALRPFEYVALDPAQLSEDMSSDEDFVQTALPAIQAGQLGLAIIRSLQAGRIFSAETHAAATYGMGPSRIIYSYDTGPSIVSGMSGYDIDASLVFNLRAYQKQDLDLADLDEDVEPDSPLAEFNMEQTTVYDAGVSSGMQLDKLMGYLARSEIPPLSERDLMSIGRFDLYGLELNYFGEDIVSAERLTFAADEFAAYIPERLSVEANALSFDIDGFTSILVSLAEEFARQPEGGDPGEPETADLSDTDVFVQGLRETQQRLPEFGLETVTGDFEGVMTWSADNGNFAVSTDAFVDGFGSETLRLSLVLPAYEAIVAATSAEPDEDDPGEPYMDLLEETFAFVGFSYTTTDLGGYDRLLGLAQAVGQAYPDQGWGAMLGNMTPEQMRSNLATIVRMGKESAADEFPPAADWMESAAAFLQSPGGTLSLSINPPEPVTSETFESLDEIEDDPQAIVDRLGISVTHTPESADATPQ